MRCVIFDALAARQQYAELATRIVRFEVVQLGGEGARKLDEHISTASSFPQAQVESPVVLLINQRVRLSAQFVTECPIGPFGCVENRIEKHAVVVGPLER